MIVNKMSGTPCDEEGYAHLSVLFSDSKSTGHTLKVVAKPTLIAALIRRSDSLDALRQRLTYAYPIDTWTITNPAI